jgi:type II secretory pathway component PulJ
VCVGRGGALLAELLVALALGALVLSAFTGMLVSSLRWMQGIWLRAEALEVVRTVWVVLDEELRPGRPGRDWELIGEGEGVALRAFRGVARVCAPVPSGGGWMVAYRGRRGPDPARDSVLVLGADGGWRAFDIEAVGAGSGCRAVDGEVVHRWAWALPEGIPDPVVARIFERGEYHLSEGALRYRRGAGGRQPLTPERPGGGSGFVEDGEGIGIRLEFGTEPGRSLIEPFSWPSRGPPRPSIPPESGGGR